MRKLSLLLTKRWFGFFALYFVIWYPISAVMVSTFQIIQQPILLYATSAFTIGFWIFMSYMYFRKAKNDWPARFTAAFGWLVLLLFFAALLSEPVIGQPWQSVINVSTISGFSFNFAAILLGAFLAPHFVAAAPLTRSQAASQQSSARLRQELESKSQQQN